MHRSELLQLLNNYRPGTVSEAGYLAQTKRFVAANADCFDRHHLPEHITGSAWVVNPARTQTLLMHHKKLDQWFQPGGHADGDADIRRVALRETAEESGLDYQHITLLSDQIFDIDIHVIPPNRHQPDLHKHFDIRFLIEVDDQLDIPGNDESHEVRWVPLYLAPRFNNNLSTHRMIEKTRRMHNPAYHLSALRNY